MAKPIVNKITPFDATKDYIVSLSWTGNRPSSNRIIIYDNLTNSVVYNNSTTTYSLEHTIPANTLANGKYYVIQAEITDQDGAVSALSDKKLFYTLTTPSFYFSNLPEDKLKNASYEAVILYSSKELEELQTYKFYLYDSRKIKLLESDTFTNSDYLSYTYRSLQNNTKYYVQCVGYTKNGMSLNTGLQPLEVYYENPDIYSRIYVDNMPDSGCTKVTSNFIIIDADGNKTYEYPNNYIDLRNNTVIYKDGFVINGDFKLKFTGKDLWQNADILKFKNDYNDAILSSFIYPDNTLRFKLTVNNGLCNYLLYSDALSFSSFDIITLYIVRINDIYLLKVFTKIRTDEEEKFNIWYGSQMPSGAETNDIWINRDCVLYKVGKDSYRIHTNSDEPIDINENDIWIGGK